MWLVKFILKISAVLLLAVVSFFVLLAKLAEKFSSVIFGFLILVIAGCIIYCLWQTRWQDALLLLGMGVAVILLLFAIEALMMLAESLQKKIGSFIHS